MDLGLSGVIMMGLFTLTAAIIRFSPLIVKKCNNGYCKEHEKIVYQANMQDKNIAKLVKDTSEIKVIVIEMKGTLSGMQRKR